MEAPDFDLRPLLAFLLSVGILVGWGSALFFTSGCMPTIRLEWKDPSPPAEKGGE